MTRALFRHFGMTPEEIERYVEGDLKRAPLVINNAHQALENLELLTSRRIQQTLGTDWGRDMIYDGFWVDVTMSKVRKLMDAGKSVVIDDLRFKNEYRVLRQAGARLIKVERDTGEEVDPRYEGQLEGSPFDYYISNNSTLEHLKRSAKAVRESIRTGRRVREIWI